MKYIQSMRIILCELPEKNEEHEVDQVDVINSNVPICLSLHVSFTHSMIADDFFFSELTRRN